MTHRFVPPAIKRFCARLAKALLVVVCLLGVGEVLARVLTGRKRGPDTSFASYHGNVHKPIFAPQPGEGGAVLSVSPDRAHEFQPHTFSLVKPADTFRVFCLGGSAARAEDVPRPQRFTSLLEGMLAQRRPRSRFEVINLGRSGSGSAEIRYAADEIARYPADLWIFYTGHNEYLNYPYRVFSKTRPNAEAGPLAASHLMRLIRDRVLTRSLRRAETVEERLRNSYAEHQALLHEFAVNLAHMVRTARERGVRVVLASPVSNLKIPPFSPAHLQPLSRKRRLEFAAAYGQGLAALMPRPHKDPLKAARRARSYAELSIRIDKTHAGAHYLLAKALEALACYSIARHEYQVAIDLDTASHRAKSAVRDVLASVADQEDALFVDLRPWFEKASPHGIWSHDCFVDHVHLNARGHAVVAQALCDAIEQARLLE